MKAGFLYQLPLCSLWCVQMMDYIETMCLGWSLSSPNILCNIWGCVDLSPPSVAYMGQQYSITLIRYWRQWTGSSLVQVMACHLFGAKPLPEPMQPYCQLDSWEQISVKFEQEFCNCNLRKCNWKCCLLKWWVAILSRGRWVNSRSISLSWWRKKYDVLVTSAYLENTHLKNPKMH